MQKILALYMLWVSTNTGFYIFSPEGQLIKRPDGYSVKDIGHAWMLFGRQLYLLHIDPRSHRVICNSKKYFADCSCNIVFADKQRRLWIGANNGLFIQDLQRKIIDASPIAAGNMIDSKSGTLAVLTFNKINR